MNIILGSGSPRRKELLEQIGYPFEVLVSEADENIETSSPVSMVEELSCRKASAVARTLIDRNDKEDYLIIGADTIVVLDDQIIGKPADKEDAYQMMRNLSGRTHQVYTGASFLIVKNGQLVYKEKLHDRTDVSIRKMAKEEIADYIENCDDWKDKAGGYGIQTAFGAKFIPSIQGDYYNVVGLPACMVGQKITSLLEKEIMVADAYKAAGQFLDMPCGGLGNCEKCKVKIKENGEEREVLACQTPFTKEMELVLEENCVQAQILADEDDFEKELSGKYSKEDIGIAIDIGTTTIAVYAYSLGTGARISVKSTLNTQISHGADVIARIQYATQENQLLELQKEMLDSINTLIDEMCREYSEMEAENIKKVVLCGNSTMQHFFFGWSPEKLGKSPYTNVNEEYIRIKGKKSGLHCNEEAKVMFLPLMGSFVGADTTSCLLTIPDDEKVRLLVDLGTNGEIALGNEKRGYLFASTACGPALEGGSLDCGMRATKGAIEKVKFEKGHVVCQTIGDSSPKGICGSGVVSVLAALLKAGIITKEGNMLSKKEFLMKHPTNLLATKIKEVGPNNLAFFLTKGSRPVYISQQDIRKIQVAKSSIYSGCVTLAQKKGMALEEIDELVLAGAFGNYIDVEDAMHIGLLPSFPEEKIKAIGNGAGLGVQEFLFQPNFKERSIKIKQKSTHVNLAKLDEFRDSYVNNMNFQ